MRKAFARLLPTLLGLGISAAPGQSQDPSRPSIVAPSPPSATRVLRVIDGDTVVLSLDSKPTTVRLIGLDTPETVHPTKPVERFGHEATRFLKELIEGRTLRMFSPSLLIG